MTHRRSPRYRGRVPGTSRVAAVLAAAGLMGVSAVHALWAAGSTWPARDDRALAELVVGSETMPPRAASAAVALGAAAAALCVAGVGGTRRPATGARLLIGAGLLGRAAVGGVVAARMLGLPEPGTRFRAADARLYRPLCAVLGVAALLSARQDAARGVLSGCAGSAGRSASRGS